MQDFLQQMKLIKTSRRSRMKSDTLNSLMTVKLLSESIQNFQPDEAVEQELSEDSALDYSNA
ncbi:hypothetical protein DPMN_049733 [Dreissena polymorpha]|uniref:Uncharacterized protein n=1 Tax=Dreissena polymorpha TaxID=45954 RepID=A0A9D4CGG0_DREPO|nr:hypothetical protein DPMN_049733 [Dreissena polymorpha]